MEGEGGLEGVDAGGIFTCAVYIRFHGLHGVRWEECKKVKKMLSNLTLLPSPIDAAARMENVEWKL